MTKVSDYVILIYMRGGDRMKIMTDNYDEMAKEQLAKLDHYKPEESNIVIMPDCHGGKGAVIGTTMTFEDYIIPSVTGVDLGCGVLTYKLKDKEVDLDELDNFILNHIPFGRNINKEPNPLMNLGDVFADIDIDRAYRSIGTLGSGNHFIEMGRDEEDNLYLSVHTGSRKLGYDIADFYINMAQGIYDEERKVELDKIIKESKENGEHHLIQNRINEFNSQPMTPPALIPLQGQALFWYMHDVKIAQDYSNLNRKVILDNIVGGLGLSVENKIHSIHNYIDFGRKIIRKGAIRADRGEMLVIPLNMRDGIILARGKGNPDWNYSAPHGAGRIMSRTQARKELTMDDFKGAMDGVYSSRVSEDTLDEAPMAYKNANEIIEKIEPTVDIINLIKPIYNFKA